MGAAVEFVDLGYLQLLFVLFKLTTVTNPPPPFPPTPPHSAASEFDANIMISVFNKINQILNVFWGCRPLLVRM